MAESVSKFAQEAVLPRARPMDEAEAMDPALVEQLFEQGLMGIEIPEEYGGAGMNFTAAIVGIEELARTDPSVSIMVDVHNTLVNSAFLRYGSAELRKRFLPQLATSAVGMVPLCLSQAKRPFCSCWHGRTSFFCFAQNEASELTRGRGFRTKVPFVCRSPPRARTHLR